MDPEFAWYASHSGLPAGTINDHMLAYYKSVSGLGTGTVNEHMLKYFQTQNADASTDLDYQAYKFYNTHSGSLGGTLTDVMVRFFQSPPSGAVEHRIWASLPGPLENHNDLHGGIRVMNTFLLDVGAAGTWKITGARLYMPWDGGAGAGWVLELRPPSQVGSAANMDAGGPAPTQSVALPDLTVGQVIDVSWPVKQAIVPGEQWGVSYLSPAGNYMAAVPALAATSIVATDGAPIRLGGSDSPNLRGKFSYQNGDGNGNAGFWAGIDILMEVT